MTDYKQIMKLLLKNTSVAQINLIVECSNTSIGQARAVLAQTEMDADAVDALTDSRLQELFPDGRRGRRADFVEPDLEAILKALKGPKKPTLKVLWVKYLDSTPEGGQIHYSYRQFCQLIRDHTQRHDLVAVITHEPGQEMYVDWAGDPLQILDPINGTKTKAYLFVAVLPFSGIIFARAYTNMRMTAWLDGHAQAFTMFGGVPELVVCDNAATATYRPKMKDAHRSITAGYQDFAHYYGTAIVPAKVYKPRYKAAVETAVRVCQTWITEYLSDQNFATLAELNTAIRDRLAAINNGPFRGADQSRLEIFTLDEKPFLQSLPSTAWQHVELKQVKVAKNYHVHIHGHFYSVPPVHVGAVADIVITEDTVHISINSNLVASHERYRGRVSSRYSTDPSHVPDQHKDTSALWSRQRFVDRASRIGPHTRQVIEDLFDTVEADAQAFHACNEILNRASAGRGPRLENACRLLIESGRRVSKTAVKDFYTQTTFNPGQDSPRGLSTQTTTPITAGMVRGADAYRLPTTGTEVEA